MKEEKKSFRGTADINTLNIMGLSPTLTTSMYYAKGWLTDALQEAKSGKGRHSLVKIHALRKEIIFSVCFLESYIFEWTQNQLTISQLKKLFPDDKNLGGKVRCKWNEFPKKVYQEKNLGEPPEIDTQSIKEICTYRNGLVHGSANRLEVRNESKIYTPTPSYDDIASKPSGWAVNAALNFVITFHHQIKTSPPKYIQLEHSNK